MFEQKQQPGHVKIPVGVSSCLLGQKVRFDGGHKNNGYICKTLGQYFELLPFCPEVGSGMSIPRPPVQLRMTEHGIRCVGVKDHTVDVTDQLQQCAAQQNQWLEQLCGYIFKKDSPSCGINRVKVYHDDYPKRNGVGVFAKYVQDHFPMLPVEEEGRLGDPFLRENFIQRVYVMQRWKTMNLKDITPYDLMVFHARHKLILMSHDQNMSRSLGRLVASATASNINEICADYGLAMMTCLQKIATRGNHVNVLQHIQGYLKNGLCSDDKAELIEMIERYRLNQLPLIVPITLLRHHFRKKPDEFIDQSFYMHPYPQDLTVLNSI